jgi:hypothetical protein
VSQDWPSAPHHKPEPLPRIDDLPVAWEGYDRAWVEQAFDTFYRHIAQLDSTLRALEAVEVFREQAADLRADLRSMRAAGWSPYPRGYPVATRTTAISSLPGSVPRIALEVAFLVVVSVIVAVASFSALEVVAVILIALALTFLIEFMAARDRSAGLPFTSAEPAGAPVPAPVAAPPPPKPEPVVEGAGWAAFSEPSGTEALTIMGTLAGDEEREPAVEAHAPAPEPVPEPVPAPVVEAAAPPAPSVADEDTEHGEPPPEPVAEPQADIGDTLSIPADRRVKLRRKRREQPTAAPPAPAQPKRVRVLPASNSEPSDPHGKTDEYPAWERGFDFSDDE